MKNLKSKIEEALKEDTASRNSDVRLTNYLWVKYHQDRLFQFKDKWSVRLMDIYDLPNIDDVKRIRAWFNSRGMYLPTSEKVAKQRRINEEIWRSNLGYSPRQEDLFN